MTVMLACTIESARGRRLVYTVHGGLRLHVIGKTVAGPQGVRCSPPTPKHCERLTPPSFAFFEVLNPRFPYFLITR